MSHDLRRWRADVLERLRRGEHLVLYGPRGAGKSTLLAGLYTEFRARGVPCALASAAAHLDDLTRALEQAYPDIDTANISRRRARSRLRLAADQREGVLLLDHVSVVGTAMIGLLRRLRGGIAGVMLAVDIETERERLHLRSRQLGTVHLPMLPLTARRLHRLFRQRCADLAVPPIAPRQQRQIIRAARGRPGWIVQCARLATHDRYWCHDELYVSVLCTDTEIALRQGPLRLLPLDAGSGVTHSQSEEQESRC